MSADPAVEKIGSLWKGRVISVKENGDLVTNFLTEEIVAYSKAAKVWIEFGNPPMTIRGISPSRDTLEKGKFFAMGGATGFLEISVRDGSVAEKAHLSSGAPITLHFRT